MAAYTVRVTRPGHKTQERAIKPPSGAVTAHEGARCATVDTDARAEVIADGKVTAVYERGARVGARPRA